VKLVDMPGVADAETRVALEGAVSALRDRFPEMFKASSRCKPPHLNIDNLKDHLFRADVMLRFELKSEKMLLDWLLEQNLRLAQQDDAVWWSNWPSRKVKGGTKDEQQIMEPTATFEKALAKARLNQFYLGMHPKWLE
ncbi:hypothetical protein CYMTET_8127, partial [Cymbomonas tetramitiformis]